MIRLTFIKRLIGLGLISGLFTALAISLPVAFASSQLDRTTPQRDRAPAESSSLPERPGVAPPDRPASDPPYTVTLLVDPPTLIANSGFTAQITATVMDSASLPISNVVLSGLLNPPALGTLTGLGPTDLNGQAAGVWTVSTTIGSGQLIVGDGIATGTLDLTATAGSLASLTVSPDSVTVTAGSSRVFTAGGFDAYSNSLPITPAWSTNGGAVDVTGLFTAATIVANGRLVTATQDAVSATAVVNIVAGPPAILSISPPAAVISAGTGTTYTLTAYDAYDNLIGDVTDSAQFQIAPAPGGAFAGNVVTPTRVNTYTVTGTYGALSTTALLIVTPADMSRLAIENAPAGAGAPIGPAPLSIYDSLTAYAAAYDRFDNLIGPVEAEWAATGILAGTVTPTTGISTVLTPAPVLTGSGVISASYTPLTGTTGLITIQAPNLKISKTASPSPVEPSEDLQYTIIYTNAGSVTAQAVVITETYPAGTSYNLASPLPTGGNNVWSIGNVVPGGSAAIVVSLRVTDSMPVGSVLTDAVTIGAAKAATATFMLTTPVVSAPVLNVSVSENRDPVRVGQSLVYVIQYRNNGNSEAHDVRITETYPAEVTFESAVPPPTLTPTPGVHVWLPGELQPGGSGSIIVTVRVHSPLPDLTVINNRVDISSVEQPTPAIATESTLAQSPILALTKLSNVASPQANSGLTYTLVYTNSGSTYATSVVVTDVLPGNTAFQDCAPIGCVYNPLTRKVTWNPGEVASQDVRSLTLTLAVANNLLAGTLLTNTAGLVAAENVAAAASLTNVIASQPILNLVVGNGVSGVAAGDRLTYTLAYFNSGNSPAQNVVITNQIPSPASFLGCSNACLSLGNGTYSFAPGTVNAASGGVVTLSVKVSDSLPAGLRSITDTALITTTTPTGALAGHWGQDVDAITTHPILTLTADYDSSLPVEGKVITYTLTYTNISAMDTTGVVLTVTRSPYADQASPDWVDHGQQASLSVGDLAADESGSALYAITLPLTFTPGMAAVVNDFIISDNGPGGLPVAIAMTATAVGVPDLTIDSVTLSPPIIVGAAEFTATVIVRNAGTGLACNPNKWPCAGSQNGRPIGGFFIDAFLNPPVAPSSFPFERYGDEYQIVGPLAAGEVITIVFSHLTFAGNPPQPDLYVKIDNYACPGSDCDPSAGQRGLVPESDESNNVFGPVSSRPQVIYLPLIRK